ncbi:hypothetical protein [Mesorhizobium sp. M0088]|uniref:hypothetical protein n=1 Tax=Mesorhizobium sp. M0088 TaxID=2956873 RepID=UPI0033391B77
MTKFRKGDIVAVKGVVAGDHVFDGKIKVQIEPYHDIYVPIANLTMDRAAFEVGDIVILPTESSRHAEVLAVNGDCLWVSFSETEYATWTARFVQRVAPIIEPEPETIEAAPVSDAA